MTELVRQDSEDSNALMNTLARQETLRPTTVAASGVLLMCVIVVLQDPLVLESCERIAQHRRVRHGLLKALRWIGQQTAAELETRV